MKISLLLNLFFYFSIATAQFQPLGKGLDSQGRIIYYDSINNHIYAGGNFRYSGNLRLYGIGRWDGNSWDSLGAGASGNPVLAITRYNGKLYASGDFYNSSWPYEHWLSWWNGQLWDSVDYRANGYVFAFKEYNNELYMGGNFTKMGSHSTPLIAKYDGQNITSFPLGTDGNGYSINAIEFFQGQMYIGGNYYDTLNQINDLARWNGTNFEIFGGHELGFGFTEVSDLAVFNNELYISGNFTEAGGNPSDYIMKWDGNQFLPVGNGLDYVVSKMHVFSNSLYVCGKFTMAGNSPASGIARLNGQHWDSICPFFMSQGIADFLIKDDILYITGGFNIFGPNDTCRNIAKYQLPVSVNESTIEESIKLFPNPCSEILHLSSLKKVQSIRIFNTLGDRCMGKFGENKKTDINVSSLSSGVYFLLVEREDGRVIKKFLKE